MLNREILSSHERTPLIRLGESAWRSFAPIRVFGNILIAAIHAGVSLLILLKFESPSVGEFPSLNWFYVSFTSFVVNTLSQIALNVISVYPSLELMFSGVVLSVIQAGPALHGFSTLGLTIYTDEESAKLNYSRHLIVKLMTFTAPQVMVHLHAFIYVNYHHLNQQQPFVIQEGLIFFGCCVGIMTLVFGYATCMENAGFDVLPLVALPMFLRVFGEVMLRILLFTLLVLKFQVLSIPFFAASCTIYALAVLWKEKSKFYQRIPDLLISVLPAFFVSRVYVVCRESDLLISKFPIFDKRLTWLRLLENIGLIICVVLVPPVEGAIEVNSSAAHIALGFSLGLWIIGILVFEKIVH
jgi:hypothetical protein